MKCQSCNYAYNTSTNLPLLTPTGNTLCSQCHSPSTMSPFKILNKTLIKIMGYCPQHLDQELSLYDVEGKKRHCAKCVIYDKGGKYGECVFVDLGPGGDRVDGIVKGEIEKMGNAIGNMRSIVVRSENVKKEARDLALGKLEQKYQNILSEINRAYQTEKQAIQNSIQLIWKNMQDSLLPQLQQMSQMQQKTNKIVDKLEKITQAVKLNKNLSEMNQKFVVKGEVLSKDLRNYGQEYRCDLGLIFCNKAQPQKAQKIIQIHEQSLLQNLENQQFPSQITYIEIMPKKQKECLSICTERTAFTIHDIENENEDIISLAQTKTINKPRQNRNVLTVKNIQQMNKIETSIREINAHGLEIGNTDAKKIIGLLGKSFVKCLDLSGNKITGIFLKDLNKSNIGKYLKEIRLRGNQIDSKDAAIIKKIEQLKAQGVTIVL